MFAACYNADPRPRLSTRQIQSLQGAKMFTLTSGIFNNHPHRVNTMSPSLPETVKKEVQELFSGCVLFTADSLPGYFTLPLPLLSVVTTMYGWDWPCRPFLKVCGMPLNFLLALSLGCSSTGSHLIRNLGAAQEGQVVRAAGRCL